MSDKSFGDFTSRNIVKNPLLSSAVTGLSIEDLTHNAVLLPAVPSQELITRQDQKHETLNTTLRHAERDIANLQYGDANSNVAQFYAPTHTNSNPLDVQKQTDAVKINEFPNQNSTTIVSKASSKPDDDFDVNEYFARLQTTRYVSAPLNSTLKEDQNANLQAEENLEEINLNEPDKTQCQDDPQQSLTADIAQNFSQLPTVLPQVASAVFSSFSNMLSMKSREQTPDNTKVYQETQMQRPEAGVTLGVPEVPKSIAPPPLKEPPVTGIPSNYRITTKKKVYAQIPGLSSGDSQNIRSFNTEPIHQAPPSFFIPDPNVTSVPQLTNMPENVSLGFDVQMNQYKRENPNYAHQSIHEKKTIDVLYPVVSDDVDNSRTVPVAEKFVEFKTIEQQQNLTINNPASQAILPPQNAPGPNPIIPPPPMFSNSQRRDSQSSIGKTVLPPSVARRISANQPIIKTQVPASIVPQENIFIPAMIPSTDVLPSFSVENTVAQTETFKPFDSSQNLSSIANIVSNEQSISMPKNEAYNLTSISEPYSQTSVPPSNNIQTIFGYSSNIPSISDVLSHTISSNSEQQSISSSDNQPHQSSSHTVLQGAITSSKSESTYNLQQMPIPSVSQVNIDTKNTATPMFFNPLNLPHAIEPQFANQQENVKNTMIPQSDSSNYFADNTLQEPPKPIPEPPKFAGSQSYRMTKKRPQYYSGPIEGVGSISNSVKPIINPVETSSYQGALFTPDQNVQVTTSNLEYNQPSIPESVASFDINKKEAVSLQPVYDISLTQEQTQPSYNTTFDLSRPTTDNYEPPSQESKSFGIIGSLKSKLSSLDINKIQNSVTTFFDPAYNDAKVESVAKPDNTSYYPNFSADTYSNYAQSEGNTFEVFVPYAAQEQYSNQYNKDNSTSLNQNQQPYHTQSYFVSQNQEQSSPTQAYYPGWQDSYNQQNSSINPYLSTQANPTPHIETNNSNENVVKPTILNKSVGFQESTHFHEDVNKSLNVNILPVTQQQQVPSSVPKLPDLLEDNDNKRFTNDENIIKTETLEHGLNSATSFFDNTKQDMRSLFESNIQYDMSANKNPLLKQDNKDLNIHQATIDSNDKHAFYYDPLNYQTELASKSGDNNLNQHTNIHTNSMTVATDLSKTIPILDSSKSFFDYQQPMQQSFFDIKTNKSDDKIKEESPPKTSQVFQKPDTSASASYFDQHTIEGDKENKLDNLNAPKQELNVQDLVNQKAQSVSANLKEHISNIKIPDLKDLAEGILPPALPKSNTKHDKPDTVTSDISKDVNQGNENWHVPSIAEQQPFSLFEQPLSIPSFDLTMTSSISTIEPVNPSDMNEIETKLENVSLQENILKSNIFEKTSSSYFDKIDLQNNLFENQVSELNICETCREVNKPEEKEVDDLTTQLIENITAPIQLANPVEYPLVDSPVGTDIPTYPIPETSHLAEDINETIKLPPVNDLIDDISVNNSIVNYGWLTADVHPSNVLDHEYNFQPDANAVGFFQDKSLFFENIPTNASDEIKAEYRISQEEPILMPLPMNIPTAPPEEDTKSDESGLDVHSIEQDAKKDFPIFEEFVIEPSETDDDKIEYKEREKGTGDSTPEEDTFTNRVERYKKMETSTDISNDVLDLQKEVKASDLPTSTSPAITIASYFDTGNYAVENHYRNSLTSPTTLSSFNAGSNASMRIPPGFEGEFQRRVSGVSSQDLLPDRDNQNVPYVPETSTQTPVATTLTFSRPVDLEEHAIHDEIVETVIEKILEDSSPIVTTNTNIDTLPPFSIFNTSQSELKIEKKEDMPVSIDTQPAKTEEQNMQTLPDPMNFFASSEPSTETSDVYSNFSRLSSYFSTPPKDDHSKSFFELSQSQNHYRHKNQSDTFNSIQNNVQNFFETAESRARTENIPQNYLNNMTLVRDLASSKNFSPKTEVVRTVNYFTVEYDFDNIKDISIGEPKSVLLTEQETKITERNYEKENRKNNLGDVDETNLETEDIIINCKRCCDTKDGLITFVVPSIHTNNYKIKKCMDNKSENGKDIDSNMDDRKDSISKSSVTVNFYDSSYEEETNNGVTVTTEHRSTSEYGPVKYHWFYRVDAEDKSIWRGFSVADSRALENAYNSPDLNENTLVATDGGRFDVNVVGRLRTAVYWNDKPTNVRRCSWFYKGTTDARYVPYTESVAEKLEEEYRRGMTTGSWHRRLSLPNSEMVVMHGPAVMVHFLQSDSADAFSTSPLFTFGKRVYRNPPKIRVSGDQDQRVDHLIMLVHGAGEYRHQQGKIQSTMRPRVVRRGCVESEIEDTEPSSIDHLLLLCHGVGSACDMRFRPVEEVVDDFRVTSLQLIQSHYKNSYDSGLVGRVEVLPISWHSSLHSGETGVDRRLAAVTLESIPRLRNFTNDTILDVLFYTSPVFCQTIIDTVCNELNRIYTLFKARNPDFKGGVSLGGHSLGSVILYDLLCHQVPRNDSSPLEKHYMSGLAGTGQPSVKYPSLLFKPDALYALGSPIAIFECIRGVETLGQDFHLPTCKKFFNIFHPYDPIAYRIEPMINPLLRDVKPSLIPHHKGRKRMHLELKDTMARVGADIKQKLLESIKSTWSSMWKTQPPPDTHLEKVVEEEMEKEELTCDSKEEQIPTLREATPDMLGKLNGGRRIDHVLQEAPFEMINEYLFAMSSHVCYWESEDTMLVMLREIYNSIGVTPDCSVPQQTMTVQRTRTREDSLVLSPTECPSTSRGTP